MLSAARRYLARVVPWDGVHYINIHHKRIGASKESGVPGTPHLNLNSAIQDIAYWTKLGDIWVCMASQKVGEERTGKNGRKYLAAVRNIANIGWHKSIYLELDVKEGKDGYENPQAAKQALKEFLVWSRLPAPSIIVASGRGGIHVYWCAVDAFDTRLFRSLSQALVRMAQAFGLRFDSQCTVDTVRLLRPPDTFNYKAGGPYPTTLLYESASDIFIEKLQTALAGYTQASPEEITLGSRAPLPADADDLSAGITRNILPPSNIDKVATVCPYLKRTLETAGAGQAQPLWFLALRIATCCESPLATAHRLSSGHQDYDETETVEAFDRLVREKVAKPSLGPPRCETIRLAGAVECRTCPHLKLNKAPLNLPGVMGAIARTSPLGAAIARGADLMPRGYFRGDDGCIYGESTDGDIGKDALIFPYQILDPWVESGREYALNFTTYEEGNRAKHVRIALANLSDRNASGRAFMIEGLPLRVTDTVQGFFVSFIKQLRDSVGSIVRCDPVGWYEEEGARIGFAYNGVLYTKDGEKIAQAMDAGIRKYYAPTGTPNAWLRAVSVINAQRRPALDMLVLSAFASPLIALAGQNGVSVGGWSTESGVGKTTALQIAQSVWGHPIKASGGLNDTVKSTFHRAGLTRNLPLIWDEIKTQKQTTTFVNTIFTVSSGKEDLRLSRAIKIQPQGEWQAILTYASNASMSDALIEQLRSTQAGHMRVFEFKVPPGDNIDTVLSMATLVDSLRSNYGHAGLIYAKWLGENCDYAKETVDKIYNALALKVIVKNEERFWLAAMATTLAGGLFANKLGLTQVDLVGLKAWLIQEFSRMRGENTTATNDFSNSINIMAILSQFLDEKRAINLIKTDKVPIGRGKPPPNSIKIMNEGSIDRLQAIHVQIAVEPRIIRIADYALTEWCKAHNVPKSALIEGMRTTLAARWTAGRLGSGTRFSTVTAPIWELLVAGTALESATEL